MGNVSGSEVKMQRTRRHARTRRPHYKNRTHRRRHYHGGLSSSKLSKVVSASATPSLDEDTSAAATLPSSKSVPKKLKPVRNILLVGVGKERKLFNPVIQKHVKAAKETRLEVEEAEARVAASKQLSRKRSPKRSAQPLIDLKKMQAARKKTQVY